MVDQKNTSSGAELTSSAPFDFHLAGLAVQLSWLYLLLYSGGWNSALAFTRASGSFDFLYLVSAAALCLALLAGILRTKQFMALARNRTMEIAAPCFASAGTLLYCLILHEEVLLPLAGGVLTGIGSAFLWARWAAVFGRFRPQKVIGTCPLIMAVAVLLCFTVGYLDPLLQTALVILLPIASGLWLHSAERTPAPSTFTEAASVKASKRHYAVLIGFAAFLGFATGILPAFSFGDSFPSYDLVFYSGIAILMLLFVALAIFADNRHNFPLLFVVPTVVTLCVLLPFSRFVNADPLLAMMGPLGCIAFELFLLIGAVLFARMANYSPARTYMITRLSMTVFDILGLLCGRVVMDQAASNVAMQIAAVIVFLITEVIIAVLAFAYLSNRKGLLGKAPAPSKMASAMPTAPSPGMQPAEAVETAPSANATVAAGIPVATDSPSRRREPEDTKPNDSTAPQSPSLADRCQQLGQQHGLSAREMDVLQLVAQGRSYARIREDLTISQGTVNYHMSNLYAKLGVHSRQEVIDLVQDTEC